MILHGHNGFLKSKMQKLETQVLKSRLSYNNLTEREITFYTGLTMQLSLWALTKVSICAKLCVKTMSMQDPVFPAFAFLILKSHLHSLGRIAFCSRMQYFLCWDPLLSAFLKNN
jgi:hypothetical protein